MCSDADTAKGCRRRAMSRATRIRATTHETRPGSRIGVTKCSTLSTGPGRAARRNRGVMRFTTMPVRQGG